MKKSHALFVTVAIWFSYFLSYSAPFDAAPFGFPIENGRGVMWEDPREVHSVVVYFKDQSKIPDNIVLQYWGSRWPHQRLPKDKEPGGGDVGWMELGNWYRYGWRTADTIIQKDGNKVIYTFNPVNKTEFPDVRDYSATFRYTLKIRVTTKDNTELDIRKIEAFTDSILEPLKFRVVFDKEIPSGLSFDIFNGSLINFRKDNEKLSVLAEINSVKNSDPNTFDKTLVTIHANRDVTFKVEDLKEGEIYIPFAGIAVLNENDMRDYATVEKDIRSSGKKSLYERVSELPEQTWRSAWEGMPPKKSHIYFPMGMDGGRQRFRLNADGSVDFRTNDGYLERNRGKETPRLSLERAPMSVRFSLPAKPISRSIEDASIPICRTSWKVGDVEITQIAFVTLLDGVEPEMDTPEGDAFAVCMMMFTVTNRGSSEKEFSLPVNWFAGNKNLPMKQTANNFIATGNDRPRFQLITDGTISSNGNVMKIGWRFAPQAGGFAIFKIPYVVLTDKSELESLSRLDFATQRKALAKFWQRRLNQSANLITPEPMLNEFYRAHAGHLLINCERESGKKHRFARVGSFSYGAYGNESCMMVIDLERRGYHKEAQECLDAWVHYQGTVGLPGDFSTKDGVLYGAGGYEAGGYNQHHGWILWMIAEHYRYTRDEQWLRSVAPAIVKGADWIIRETERTKDRHELERGLLPAGSLEDIGDWWTWLSTSCYTWRGLDNAAWALEQIGHPEAKRIRSAASAYHFALTNNFTKAAHRSPVVRLRDGTAVMKYPSHVHRRGRSFGWICETLEGAIHLLITKAIDPRSTEALWIMKDYEDNLYLSNQYGYTLDDFEKYWFGRGGMSMQACLLLGAEPYLYRDDVKQALRAIFNAQAVSYFPDVRMNTEHALPEMGDWRGDHYKSSDESNSAGWLRYLFVREEEPSLLLIGQAVPREWLEPGKYCGIEKTTTWFGTTSVLYSGFTNKIMCQLKAPHRNPPQQIRVRFRTPGEKPLKSVSVNGVPYKNVEKDWVILSGNTGNTMIVVEY